MDGIISQVDGIRARTAGTISKMDGTRTRTAGIISKMDGTRTAGIISKMDGTRIRTAGDNQSNGWNQNGWDNQQNVWEQPQQEPDCLFAPATIHIIEEEGGYTGGQDAFFLNGRPICLCGRAVNIPLQLTQRRMCLRLADRHRNCQMRQRH